MKAWLATDMNNPKEGEVWTRKPKHFDINSECYEYGNHATSNDCFFVVKRSALDKSIEQPPHGTRKLVPVTLTITKR